MYIVIFRLFVCLFACFAIVCSVVHFFRNPKNCCTDPPRENLNNMKKRSAAKMKVRAIMIKSVQISSVSELSSGTFGNFKVYY